MHTAQVIESGSDRGGELDRVEQEDSAIVVRKTDGCCAIPHCDKFAESEGCETIELRGESRYVRIERADREMVISFSHDPWTMSV